MPDDGWTRTQAGNFGALDPSFYHEIFQHHPLPAWIYDLSNLKFLAVNLAAVVEYGYSEEEFLRMRISDIRFDENRRALDDFSNGNFLSHIATGPRRHQRQDGSSLVVYAYSNDLTFRGRPARLQVINDVSERKRLEQDLRLFAAAVASASESVMITEGSLNPPGPRIVFVNDAFCSMTGFSQIEVLGKNPSILQGPKSERISCRKIALDLEQFGSASYESINYRKDGTEYTVEWQVSAVRDEWGETTHYLSLQRDVTERNRLQEQFQQAQKMEAVGRLAGGIAHDFNNILTIILGYAGLLSVEMASDANEKQLLSLNEIQKAAEKAAALTSQLLAFSRKEVTRTRIIDINPVISHLERMLHRLIGEDITLKMALQPDLGCVLADPGHVEQVLMNLSVNARDAMPHGGALTISTSDVEITSRYVPVTPLKPGSYIILSVSDTGHGMDEATRLRIFEPFFTTKEAGRGTGLGLSMVYGFVKQIEGHIVVESELDKGTCFRIYLPKVASLADAEKQPELQDCGTGSGTILVVEDEAGIREIVREILCTAGYEVHLAANAQQAAEFAASHTGPIDLLLSDVVMPGGSGPHLAAQLKEFRPELNVLFASGYSDHAMLPQGNLDKGVAFVQKPFDKDMLLSSVSRLLKAEPSARRAHSDSPGQNAAQ